MKPHTHNSSTEQQPLNRTELNLLEYWEIIYKYRKLIGYIVGAALILSWIVSLVLPKMYIATSRVVPPQETNHGLASLLSGSDDPLGGLAGNLIGNQTPATLYVGILKSRSVADALTQKFDLKKLYGSKYIEDVYRRLAERSTIKISKKDQLVIVSVKDRDPQRAADMANTYVDMLNKINRDLNITRGKRKRLFLEGRLKEVRRGLGKAEIELKAFQEKYNLVSIEEQAKVAIKGAADIKGQIIAAQTELEVFKQFGTERQIEAVMLNAKIEGLQKQLDAIEHGKKMTTDATIASGPKDESNFYIPFDDLPDLGMQLVRLTRNAKIQEKLFELLSAQYEMARIEESRDMNTIQVLDSAVPPEKKSSPKQRVIVISSILISALFAVLLAFILEYYHSNHANQQ